MKLILKSFRILTLIYSPLIFAGASEGYVTTPLVNSHDVLMFSAGTHVQKPACATQELGTWAVNLKTEHGKAIMSLVLTAQAQRKRLHVVGKNNCDVWGDRESISYVYMVE